MRTLRNVLACAWVLWQTAHLSPEDVGMKRYPTDRPGEYTRKERVTTRFEAHESKEKCDARKARFEAVPTHPDLKISFECLPDSIDPRPR